MTYQPDSDHFGWSFERTYKHRRKARLLTPRGWTYVGIVGAAIVLGIFAGGFLL